MKIAQLISGIKIALTNEEVNFVKKYGKRVQLLSLSEHSQWIAQNLVRKGVYSISKDNNTLVKEVDENSP